MHVPCERSIAYAGAGLFFPDVPGSAGIPFRGKVRILSPGARYTYMDDLRPGAGRWRRTIVKPQRSRVESSFPAGHAGCRREMMSWYLCSPQNGSTPVPPQLKRPWTNGISSLFCFVRDRNVSLNEAAV